MTTSSWVWSRVSRPLMFVLAAIVVSSLLPADGRADMLIFSNYTGESTATGSSDLTTGSQFTVGPQNLLVLQLGVYDAGGDGLGVAHQVGIWRVSDQVLVVSATVPSGAVPPLIEDWRFTPVTAFTLTANTAYRIGAVNEIADGSPFGGTDPSLFAGISSYGSGTIKSFFSGTNSGLAFPNTASLVNRVMANADVTLAPLPEPSSLILACLSALGLAGYRWRGRRSR